MKESKKYYNNVKKLFPVHGKREKKFLADLKTQLIEYENEGNERSYQDFEDELGSPIDIVISYYQTVDSAYMLKKMNIKRIITISSVIILSLAIVVSLWNIYLYNKAYQDFKNALPTQYEETIEVY